MLRINTFNAADAAIRHLSMGQAQAAQAIKRLSSGFRINSAADDAAGLAMAQRMSAEMRASDRGSDNVQDGISMLQTADGALDQTHELLQHARELAVQAGNGTLNDQDRAAINLEFGEIAKQIDSISTRTDFNSKKLLDGSQTNVSIQSGSHSAQTFSLPDAGAAALGVGSLDANNASAAIEALDGAISQVSSSRGAIGATVNAMEHTYAAQQVASENMAAATSRIRDTDFAREISNLTRANIMNQARIAMAVQANNLGSGVLDLLK